MVCKGFNGQDADDLDDGDEGAEGEHAEEDDLFAEGDFGLDEHAEGGEHAGGVLVRAEADGRIMGGNPLVGREGNIHNNVEEDRDRRHGGVERHTGKTFCPLDAGIPLRRHLEVLGLVARSGEKNVLGYKC